MDDQTWRTLCEQIMQERDPQKLIALVAELNRALDQRERSLKPWRQEAGTYVDGYDS